MAKKFPDLTGDGKVTQADVLKGRGVFNDGGEVDKYATLLNEFELSESKAKNEKELQKIKNRRKAFIGDLEENAKLQREFDAKYKRVLIKDEDGSSRYYHIPREPLSAGGSLMVPPEREAYGKGGAILDLVAALTGKQTKSAKKKMVGEEKALQDLSKMVEDNPRVLDELSDEDYEMVVSKLPQSQAAKMGMADEPLDNMVEMARGMAPADVAKKLEMFNSIEDIFEYAEGLDAKGARQFMENLSDEDLEIFGADLPNMGATLGPREVKADGGPMPVDTYDNISPEEEMQQAEDMLPDDEMEEEFVDYVAEEVLEPEEQEYLFKVLDEDPRLEGILDKVILNATEFAGSGEVEGPGTGISDSIPARLSDGEFVITRKATDQIGADNLQTMMDDAERAYDGGLMGMANGGEAGTNPFVNPEEMYGVPKDGEEDIERQMLYSSRMPSLMNR